jgi:hypothetical protein
MSTFDLASSRGHSGGHDNTAPPAWFAQALIDRQISRASTMLPRNSVFVVRIGRDETASPLSEAKLRLSGQFEWPFRYFDDRSGSEKLAK